MNMDLVVGAGDRAVHATRGPPLRSPGPVDGVVARKGCNGSTQSHVLVGSRVDEGLGVGGLVDEGGAVGGGDAVCVRCLELGPVGPAHDEIAMVSISSGVAVSKGEMGDVGTIDTGLEVELVEEREEGNGVRLRAHSAIVVANSRVGHVALVVGSVEVFAVPARGEVHLGPELLAWTRGEPCVLATVASVNAHDGDGCLCEVGGVECSPHWIASNHSEPIGESERNKGLVTRGPSRGIVACSLLVVVCIPRVFDHGVQLGVGVVVVQLGYPVVAVVEPLVACGGCGVVGKVESRHVSSESIAASNTVDMGTGDAWEDDGIGPLDGQGCTVHCESISI